MITLVFVIRRREDMPHEEFHRYGLEEHGPPARSTPVAFATHRASPGHFAYVNDSNGRPQTA